MVRKRLRRRLGNKLMPPELKKLANELRAPGEVGRAIPGQVQSVIRNAPPSGADIVPAAAGLSEVSTRFTKPGENTLLYQAEGWVYINLLMIDAGPVSVGTRDDIAPVLSGKGGLLIQNEIFRFPVRKGQRVFITANTVARVRMTIEAPPFGEQVLNLLGSILRKG
jgi:hypothetical protein